MYWLGRPPEVCQVCHRTLGKVFYDATIIMAGGSWANICEDCFHEQACQLGVGKGQKYEQQEDGRFKCIEGGMRSGTGETNQSSQGDDNADP